jgi:hypothetical protein
MPHLPPAHHQTSKHDSPNKIKIKEKQNEIVLDSNSNLAKSMTHHNQTKELTTWFLTNIIIYSYKQFFNFFPRENQGVTICSLCAIETPIY